MFTLGDKLRVLNTDADVQVISGSAATRTSTAVHPVGTPVALSGDVLGVDTIRVNGFGDFLISDILDMKAHRYVAPVSESKDYTIIAPAGLQAGEAIEVSIYAKTSRYQGELKNNFIGAVRPITFMTAPLTTLTAAAIRTAIVTAWADRKFLFHNESSPIDVTAGVAATDIDVSTTAGYESVNITKVEIKRAAQGIGSPAPVTLAVNVVNAVGTEGLGAGKFLEESVRMATGINTNPYGVDNADTQVDLRGGYTEVSFVIGTSYDENLSTLAADHGPLPARHRFTIWLNEATTRAANGATAMFAAAGILAAAANANMTATAQSAPLTRAQEETETLRIANGDSVATVAAFIA